MTKQDIIRLKAEIAQNTLRSDVMAKYNLTDRELWPVWEFHHLPAQTILDRIATLDDDDDKKVMIQKMTGVFK